MVGAHLEGGGLFFFSGVGFFWLGVRNVSGQIRDNYNSVWGDISGQIVSGLDI